MKIKLNKKQLLIGLLLLMGVLSFVVIKIVFKSTEYNFTTVTVQKGNVSNTITATGTLEATNTVEVGTQVSGVIEKLFVDFNSKVTKGQLIAELDKITLQSSLETAEADLDKAQANFEYQAANLERNKILYEKELLAKSDYDLILFNYKTSKAEVKSAQANLDKAQRNLSYASIYSPIDGIVLNRAVEEGQTVTASMSTPELYTITDDLSVMQVEADIDEADIGQLQVGQRVEFTVDAFPELIFEGKVSEIRLQPTESSNVITYTTIVSVNNPDLNLKPGMTASITVYVEEVNDVLVLAAKAFRFTPDHEMLDGYLKSMPEDLQMPMGRPKVDNKEMPSEGMQGTSEERMGPPELDETHKVVWVKEGDIIHPIQIEIGIDDGTNVEVVSGMEEGTEVITAMAVSTGDSSTKVTNEEDDQKSPFIQERPGKNAGSGPPH
jgi:HlyD family secretion protein